MFTALRIVQIAHAYPPYPGGLSHVVENISTRLAGKGYEVEVITLDTGLNLPSIENYHGVTVKRFKGYTPLNAYYIPSTDFIKHLKRVDTDNTIFHLHNLGSVSTYLAWKALRRKTDKIVLTPHYHESGSTLHTRFLWKIYKLLVKKMLKNIKIIHAVSSFEASLLWKDFGVKPVIIQNGIGEDVKDYNWSPPSNTHIITFAGRIEKYKRVDLVVKYARRLIDLGFNIKLRLIGRGSDLKRILSLARMMGLSIEHYDFLERREYLEKLSASTVFVNLSAYEAFSIVTAEALAMGIPVVIAEPWGQTFHGCSKAHIVDPLNETGVIKALKKSINTQRKTEKCGLIKTWNEVVDEMINMLYMRLLQF